MKPPTTRHPAAGRNEMKSTLRAVDLLPTSLLGLQSRPLRALLSALGIAIGIASIVAVLGVTRSSESNLLSQISRLGTNMLTVSSGQDIGGTERDLPVTTTPMLRQISNVQAVAPTAALAAPIYRNDRMPVGETGGITVRACDASLPTTVNGSLLTGRFLAAGPYPTTVLGYDAATTLGVGNAGADSRVWLGGHWFTVVGILKPLPLAPEIDRSALVSFGSASRMLNYDGHPSRVYLRTNPDHVAQVFPLLASAANPADPTEVEVSRPSDALTAQLAVKQSGGTLIIGLGAIALLVGAIGIANVMVISVLERRNEIGLRRALGAARIHVAAQFLTESLLLSTLGGVAGTLIGAAITIGMAYDRGWPALIPAEALWGAPGVAIVVGAVAGLYPAVRAALIPPTDALRTI